MSCTLKRALAGAAFACLAVTAAEAATVTIDSFDTGYYQNGGGTPSNNNIIEDSTRNNYFAFDLSGVSGAVTGATLTIFGGNGSYSTARSSVLFTVYDVSTEIGALTTRAGGTAAFADLGSGTAYGSATIATPLSFGAMPEVVVDLAGGLADINASLGALFALGGGSDLTGNDGFLWISSNLATSAARLTLEVTTPVPLPASLPLLLASVGAFVALRRRSRQA